MVWISNGEYQYALSQHTLCSYFYVTLRMKLPRKLHTKSVSPKKKQNPHNHKSRVFWRFSFPPKTTTIAEFRHLDDAVHPLNTINFNPIYCRYFSVDIMDEIFGAQCIFHHNLNRNQAFCTQETSFQLHKCNVINLILPNILHMQIIWNLFAAPLAHINNESWCW